MIDLSDVRTGWTVRKAISEEGGSGHYALGDVIPHGGIVVESGINPEGERTFVTIESELLPREVRVDRVTASEVREKHGIHDKRLRIAIRTLCYEVACKGPGFRRQGSLSSREAEFIRYAWALVKAMGPR